MNVNSFQVIKMKPNRQNNNQKIFYKGN